MKHALPLFLIASIALCSPHSTGAEFVPVGAATIDVTPDYSIRLNGYSSRKGDAEAILQHVFASALAIGGDAGDGPVVLIALENCEVLPEITEEVARNLESSNGIQRDRLQIAVTHTHTGPMFHTFAPYLFAGAVTPEEMERMRRYAREMPARLTKVAREALSSRRPARLSWSKGKIGFAANRRVTKNGKWTGFGVQNDGPVDHQLPVLAAHDREGGLIAILATYACHCTTLRGDYNKMCGDWAGYARQYIQENHPGAVALITIGCGADQTPEPKAELEWCKRHGRSIADEVKRLVGSDMHDLGGVVVSKLTHISLPLSKHPSAEEWRKSAEREGARGYHARKYLKLLEEGKPIPTALRYPIACWSFSDKLAMLFLGGEVVVDYSTSLNAVFDPDRLWITSYANDTSAYIPSKRILDEGGYEADLSMIYYGQPSRFSDRVEHVLLEAVKEVLPNRFKLRK